MKNSRFKGFTLVELLCIITILGVLTTTAIVAVTKIVNTAKEDEMAAQEQLLIKTCQSYIQNHKEDEPKAIGEAKTIMISKLYDNNYLKEKIENYSGDSCMEKSYIRMYRLSPSEVIYTPYIYCGNEKVPDYEQVIEPIVNLYFVNNTDTSKNNQIFDDLDNAYIYMDIAGGTTKGDNPIAIDSYLFTISTKNEVGDMVELYVSDEISAFRKNNLNEKKKILDYVEKEELLSSKYISITVTVKNIVGGVKEVTIVSE